MCFQVDMKKVYAKNLKFTSACVLTLKITITT